MSRVHIERFGEVERKGVRAAGVEWVELWQSRDFGSYDQNTLITHRFGSNK